MDDASLSKTISHALRHNPKKYGVSPDREGWVNIQDLIKGIRLHSSEFKNLSFDDIVRVIDKFDKKRHEIHNGRIKALYGHSIKIIPDPNRKIVPPRRLFHGTKKENYGVIKLVGLKKMSRQFVHLSETIEIAKQVALRKYNEIIIVEVDALKAHEEGLVFYREDNIWLTENIPPKYIIE